MCDVVNCGKKNIKEYFKTPLVVESANITDTYVSFLKFFGKVDGRRWPPERDHLLVVKKLRLHICLDSIVIDFNFDFLELSD